MNKSNIAKENPAHQILKWTVLLSVRVLKKLAVFKSNSFPLLKNEQIANDIKCLIVIKYGLKYFG